MFQLIKVQNVHMQRYDVENGMSTLYSHKTYLLSTTNNLGEVTVILHIKNMSSASFHEISLLLLLIYYHCY